MRRGAPPPPRCTTAPGWPTGNFASCQFSQPLAGTWYVLAVRVTGTVAYQITATEFGPNSDTDEDGVENPFDNCTLVSNANQNDLDADGCGNLCDADFNQNGTSEAGDLGIFKAAYLTSQGQPGYDPLADMNGDGTVNSGDMWLFKTGYLHAPGPSGLPPELKTFPACP